MVMASTSHKGFTVRFPCTASVAERHPHRMCVGGSIPSAWVTEDMSMNGMKRMDKEKFIEAYNGFVFGGLSLEQAAKVAGRSVPTIRKYFSMVLTGQSLPKDLFIEGEKE